MEEDPEVYRARSRDRWSRAADGWGHRRDWWEASTAPVTDWLVEAAGAQPGRTVLELAAGPGDVSMRIAERLRPDGRLVATDGAEPMVDVLRARAEERGLADVVEARPMEAEWIDLPAASVDAVVCRWGLMLLADPDAALRETRRVLRPGGRIALAAWAAPERNRWSAAVGAELVARGLVPAPGPDEPGQFAWRDRATIGERLAGAGFLDVALDTVEFELEYPDLDTWWDVQIDMSPVLGDTLVELGPAARDELMEAAQARLADCVRSDGTVRVPAATHVAAADA